MELPSGPATDTTPGTGEPEPAAEVNDEPARQSRSVGVIGVLLILFVVALVGLFGVALVRRQEPSSGGFGINALGKAAELRPRPAPDFEVDSFSGGRIRMAELRGQTVVLNFWASWCLPCREEAPILAKAAETYAVRGVTFLGINVWDSDADARAFLDRYDVRYQNAPDSEGKITINYGVTGLPETFLITREGTLLKKWAGPLTSSQLQQFIEEALQ